MLGPYTDEFEKKCWIVIRFIERHVSRLASPGKFEIEQWLREDPTTIINELLESGVIRAIDLSPIGTSGYQLTPKGREFAQDNRDDEEQYRIRRIQHQRECSSAANREECSLERDAGGAADRRKSKPR